MKKHPAFWLISLTALVVSIAGCGTSDEILPEVIIDRSECAKCRMRISDARFVGMIKTDEYLMFDDLGCMLKFEKTMGPSDSKGAWVRDYFTNTWVSSDQAVFYRVDEIVTPMGYGYIAGTKNKEQMNGKKPAVYLESIAALRDDFVTRHLTGQ